MYEEGGQLNLFVWGKNRRGRFVRSQRGLIGANIKQTIAGVSVPNCIRERLRCIFNPSGTIDIYAIFVRIFVHSGLGKW